jgi:hypothetical protein
MFLLGTLVIAGCATKSGPYGRSDQPVELSRPAAPGRAATGRVAILLPLSGPLATIGTPMLQAAQLALPPGGSPVLSVRDTGGSPEGAAAAVRAAIADGSDLILGPLTAGETAAVAPIARDARLPVLAFTNAAARAEPGVWILGITPGQQVRRLVAAAQAQGRSSFAALLPQTEFGNSMADALREATAEAGLAAPTIQFYASGTAAINAAARELSGYAGRRGPIDAQIRAARAEGTPEGRRRAAELGRSHIPPAPFNALLLADMRDNLELIAAVLPYYDIDPPTVQVMGPNLWAAASSGAGALPGAWYAAPDTASRASLEDAYSARFGAPPPAPADLAFDAASIARVMAARGYSEAALTQRGGFAGVDGWLVLLPNGTVRRGLAVYRIERGGPAMIEPAPASPELPGS